MQKSIAELVHVLTEEHASFDVGTLRYEDGLIGRLRAAMRASMGMTHGGHSLPHERSALNLAAFTAYEFIAYTAGSMFQAATEEQPDRRYPEKNLQGWLEVWDLATRMGQTTAAQEQVARRKLADLVNRVDMVLNPPRVGEILGACPNTECGERYWFTDSLGSRTSALFTVLRVGEPLVAECHWCGTKWTGEAELTVMRDLMDAQDDLAHRVAMARAAAVDNATDHLTASDDAGHEHHEQETA